jgi:Fur family ferric uptake transcriptional regulator
MSTHTARLSPHERATALIGRAAAVATPARVAVLAALLQAGRPLSHAEIDRRLRRRETRDRVTLYRTLAWLTRQGLAHRIVGEDRVAHYAVSPTKDRDAHAHFYCNRCARFYCLNDVALAPARLPRGFIARDAGFVIRGRCAACAH